MHTPAHSLHESASVICAAGRDRRSAPRKDNIPAGAHDAYEIVYVRSGYATCLQGDRLYEMRPGAAIVHPPRVPHAYFPKTDFITEYIIFEGQPQTSWPRVCHDDDERTLAGICRSLTREWLGRERGRDQMLALLTQQLHVVLDRAAGAPLSRPVGEQVVLLAEQMIEERYPDSLSVAEIAREAGVSTRTLHAHFAHLRAKAPIEHLQTVRLQHALALLRQSDLTLETIAGRCGYHSASHLSRHVKLETGESPGRLRKASD